MGTSTVDPHRTDAIRTEFEVHDQRFRGHGDEWVERLHTGCRWTVGPVYVLADGSIWFSDPSYGIDSDYEGYRVESEIGGCRLTSADARLG